MIAIDTYIEEFSTKINQDQNQPWELVHNLEPIIEGMIAELDDDFIIDNSIAIHKTAKIESNVILKGPIIIGKDCFIGANSYLRNGVILGESARVGTSCEIKSSIIFDHSAVAHFNFIGDSIIGSHVNFEAGSITANHFNERENKAIFVLYEADVINTGVHKFGALIGDGTKIGANAVLSPGTLLPRKSIVKRLELIEQVSVNSSDE
ncbi:DapH/DapD/GlmU-related protein [Lutimonas halocynthiae]|uniref:DapH/DapD/GlmU-related protein n=1 Tax=Lutimonas halocynthiae TaxID=1446477 RepID=UPI0025B36DB9|nr:DapH/DapD/GlmU-related protein [Lutimonas halocynthiae]MDN3643323.1 DapH/DapD/GlmU-related protein [Lutimonas halocynthiae]